MNRRAHVAVVVGVLLGAMIACAAEEITLTTYYPSPRGVYDELRARKYASFSQPDKFWLDMESGEVRMGRVSLLDETSGRRYTLRVEDQQLLITDEASAKAFIVVDLHGLEEK